MKRLVLLISWLIIPFCLHAQKVVKECASFTYYAEGNESPNQAKQKALEGARLQVIANAFGTVISQSTTSSDRVENGQEKNYFFQLSDSEVKGEWVEDVGEPKYQVEYAQEMLIVTCTVCGRVRELSNTATNFEATVLKNGTEQRFADTSFHNGDDIYLWFRSPVDGYVAVYLIDEQMTAYCLLPYMDNATGQHAVKHNEEYVFFSTQKSKNRAPADEYTMTCENDLEQNRLYVIFSPVPFTKALDNQADDRLPRQLPYDEFNKWLGKCRRHDAKMGVKVMHIEIKK